MRLRTANRRGRRGRYAFTIGLTEEDGSVSTVYAATAPTKRGAFWKAFEMLEEDRRKNISLQMSRMSRLSHLIH